MPDEPPKRFGSHLAAKKRQEGTPLGLVRVLWHVLLIVHRRVAIESGRRHPRIALAIGPLGDVFRDLRRHAVDAIAALRARALHLDRVSVAPGRTIASSH